MRAHQHGFALITAALVLLVVGAVAWLLVNDGSMGQRLLANDQERTQLEYITQAGAAHARWALAQNVTCKNYTAVTDTPFGKHSYNATFEPPDGSPLMVTVKGQLANGINHTTRLSGVQAYEAPQVSELQLSKDPGKDAILDDFYSSRNYGGANYLEIASDPGWIQRPVLQFDVSGVPAGARIISARLQLMHQSVNAAGAATVHRMTRDWLEGTRNGGGTADGATWQTHDGSASWAAQGGDFTSTAYGATVITSATINDWVEWEIRDLVSEWLAGTPNHGLLLQGDGVLHQAKFASRETTDPLSAPKLSITYACECGKSCTGGGPELSVLLVVGDATTLASKDADRKALMESWGYSVTVIDDGESQADILAAAAANDVTYVSGTIGGGALADKLTTSTAAIVNEFPGKLDNFGFGSQVPPNTVTSDQYTGTDAAHYITQPFGGSGVAHFTTNISMSVASGTLAPDLGEVASLGTLTWGLPVLDTGAERWDGDPSPGRRVHLPFGEADISQLTTDGETLMRRAIEWGAVSCESSGTLMFIVSDDAAPTTQELARQALLESWCYTVKRVDDDAAEGDYDANIALSKVVYISPEALASEVGTKLKSKTIGIVNEDPGLHNVFGFSTVRYQGTTNAPLSTDGSHYITSPFGGGDITLFTSTQPAGAAVGTLPGGLVTIGTWSSGDLAPLGGLLTLEAGAAISGGGTAAARRVQMPWEGVDGASVADIGALTSDGKTVLERSLEWAAGPAGPPVCDADYVADTKVGEFSTSAYGSNNIQGLTFLPEGKSFNGVPAPAGGAWVSVNYSDGKFYMSDTAGAYLAELASGNGAPTGVTFVASGAWADHLAAIDQSVAEIQFVDLAGTLVASFSTTTFGSAVATGVAFIGTSASGTYDDHLAVVDSNQDMVSLITQSGSLVSSFDTSGFSTKTTDVAHLPGSDKLMLIDWNSTVFIVDFAGTVLAQYDSEPFGMTAPEAVAINPLSCDHVVGDDSPDLVVSLNQSSGGGGGGGPTVVFEEFTEGRNAVGVSSGMSIPKPGGTVAGDLLVVAVATDGDTIGSLSPSASWNLAQLGLGGHDGSGAVTLDVWWKIADGTEPSSLVFSWADPEQAYGWIMRFTGHDPSSPFATSSATTGNIRDPLSTNLITSTDGNLILRLGGFDDDDITIDAPGLPGHTVITMDRSNTGVQNTVSGGAGYLTQTTAGDTGTSNFNLAAREQYRTITIAIRPAP